jgi:hypothetical protein
MDDRQLQTVWQQRQLTGRIKHLSQPLGTYLKRDLAKRVRQVGKLADVWDEVLPRELAEHTSLLGFTRGVLTVGVDSASHRFLLQTQLQAGLKKKIQSHFGGAIRRIKLVAERPDAPPAGQA